MTLVKSGGRYALLSAMIVSWAMLLLVYPPSAVAMTVAALGAALAWRLPGYYFTGVAVVFCSVCLLLAYILSSVHSALN